MGKLKSDSNVSVLSVDCNTPHGPYRTEFRVSLGFHNSVVEGLMKIDHEAANIHAKPSTTVKVEDGKLSIDGLNCKAEIGEVKGSKNTTAGVPEKYRDVSGRTTPTATKFKASGIGMNRC